MLFLLYESLKGHEAARYLNFLRYPSFRIIAAGVAALLIGMLVGPLLIDRLRLGQHGQSNVREDTPETHQKKKGTPTMGGLIILLCIAVATTFFADLRSPTVGAVLSITFGYGVIGFFDDYLKLSKNNSKGLAGKKKLALETLVYVAAIGVFLSDWRITEGKL